MPPAFPPQELREKRDGRDGEEFEVRGFRNFEPRTSNFASCLSRTACSSRSRFTRKSRAYTLAAEAFMNNARETSW
jgi:hypothetical protein